MAIGKIPRTKMAPWPIGAFHALRALALNPDLAETLPTQRELIGSLLVALFAGGTRANTLCTAIGTLIASRSRSVWSSVES